MQVNPWFIAIIAIALFMMCWMGTLRPRMG